MDPERRAFEQLLAEAVYHLFREAPAALRAEARRVLERHERRLAEAVAFVLSAVPDVWPDRRTATRAGMRVRPPCYDSHAGGVRPEKGSPQVRTTAKKHRHNNRTNHYCTGGCGTRVPKVAGPLSYCGTCWFLRQTLIAEGCRTVAALYRKAFGKPPS